MNRMHAHGVLAVALVSGLLAFAAPRAFAAAPIGACCLSNGACVDEIEFQCAAQNGDFIGAGTTCATVECDAPLAAPLLSIGGLIAALGALAGLGAYRLMIGRRRGGPR